MTKIKIAVVGCGRISRSHFDSIKAHQNSIELISICEIDKKILSDHEKKYDVKFCF